MNGIHAIISFLRETSFVQGVSHGHKLHGSGGQQGAGQGAGQGVRSGIGQGAGQVEYHDGGLHGGKFCLQ